MFFFKDNHKNSSSSSDSTANSSRIAFKHSALEVAKVFNIFRIEFREQILNSVSHSLFIIPFSVFMCL